MKTENKKACRLFWQLFRDCWNSEEKWHFRGLFFLVIAFHIAMTYIAVLLNAWYGDFFNMLQQYDEAAFLPILSRFAVLAVIYMLIFAYTTYAQQRLQIKWRIWMTNGYLQNWMKRQVYYRMKVLGSDTDNPDQRISEDINLFAELTLQLFMGFCSQFMILVSFGSVLWNLSPVLLVPLGSLSFEIYGYMFWATAFYAVIGTYVGHLVGRRLISLNFEQQRFEADFRFGMMRARENSESIAFYGGEQPEMVGFKMHFAKVIRNYWGLMKRTKLMNTYMNAYGQIGIIFPIFLILPQYLSGVIQLGVFMQALSAFSREGTALAYFVNAYTDIARLASVTQRLSSFTMHVEEVRALESDVAHRVSAENALVLDKMEVQLPNGRSLLQDCSLSLPQGSSTLITGGSGCGKSTLLRMIAGLWPFGHGTVKLPEGSRVLFLPQRPYLPLGSLRNAICYPLSAEGEDAHLRQLLSLVGMEKLADRLDEVDDWSRILSLGEQQRIAFLRVLLVRPQWVFLDESTSALDETWERTMYELLRRELSDMSIVSVGHRSSLFAQHKIQLQLLGDGSWKLQPISV